MVGLNGERGGVVSLLEHNAASRTQPVAQLVEHRFGSVEQMKQNQPTMDEIELLVERIGDDVMLADF